MVPNELQLVTCFPSFLSAKKNQDSLILQNKRLKKKRKKLYLVADVLSRRIRHLTSLASHSVLGWRSEERRKVLRKERCKLQRRAGGLPAPPAETTTPSTPTAHAPCLPARNHRRYPRVRVRPRRRLRSFSAFGPSYGRGGGRGLCGFGTVGRRRCRRGSRR